MTKMNWYKQSQVDVGDKESLESFKPSSLSGLASEVLKCDSFEEFEGQKVLEDERHKVQQVENERRYEQQKELSKSYSELLKILAEQ